MATSVLIVDDHPSFRASARMLLECEGFDVIGEAEDGLSGLQAVARLHPDVVLLDVQLPDIPAIVLTSSRDVEDLGYLAGRDGVRGFIPKSELSGSAIEALL